MSDAPVYLLQRMLHRQTLPAWFWCSLDQCICLMMLLREIYWLCSLSSKYCCITQIGSLCFLMMPTSSGNRNDLLLFLLSGKHHIHLPKVTFLYDYVDEFHVQKTDMLINMQIFLKSWYFPWQPRSAAHLWEWVWCSFQLPLEQQITSGSRKKSEWRAFNVVTLVELFASQLVTRTLKTCWTLL